MFKKKEEKEDQKGDKKSKETTVCHAIKQAELKLLGVKCMRQENNTRK